MANSFSPTIVVLDTFTSAIDIKDSLHFVKDQPLAVESIKWQKPDTIDHTCTITDEEGREVFAERCLIANESKIEYFNGCRVSNLKIAASGVGSGKVVIRFREERKD